MAQEPGDGSDDAFLAVRLARYDRWRQEGRVAYSSRVIPVGESLATRQWVLPGGQVLELLRRARSFAVTRCECRTHYRRCDNPSEVCFLLDDVADRHVAEGTARRISLEQAAEALGQADARGLVHLTIYRPDHRASAVCSCCPCCCHDLQFLRLYGRGDLIAHSDYVAETDADACTHCGDCIERCGFGARTWDGGLVRYDPLACYGCGVCVGACAASATTLRPR